MAKKKKTEIEEGVPSFVPSKGPGAGAAGIKRLQRRQFTSQRELLTIIKKSRKRLAAKVERASRSRLISGSKAKREEFFGEIATHYERLGVELDAWQKDLVGKTGLDWHKQALIDIPKTGGILRAATTKFSARRAQRYFEIVHPDNTEHVAAVFTNQMKASDVGALREAVTETLRQRGVEGLTQNEFHKALQDRWADLAGNMNSSRFVDARGRAWTNANYISMLARTTTARIARESYADTLINNGDDLAIIRAVGDSCPICTAWKNTIVSLSGKDKRFPSYQAALTAGMFHPQCDCLLARVDETINAEEIGRQGGAGRVDFNDRDAVADRKGLFEQVDADPTPKNTKKPDVEDITKDKAKESRRLAKSTEAQDRAEEIADREAAEQAELVAARDERREARREKERRARMTAGERLLEDSEITLDDLRDRNRVLRETMDSRRKNAEDMRRQLKIAQGKKAQMTKLQAKIARLEADTAAIEKRLAAEDRRRDRT